MELTNDQITNFLEALRYFETIPSANQYGQIQRTTLFGLFEKIIPNFKKPENDIPETIQRKITEARGYLTEWQGKMQAGEKVEVPGNYAPATKAVEKNQNLVNLVNQGLTPQTQENFDQEIQEVIAEPSAQPISKTPSPEAPQAQAPTTQTSPPPSGGGGARRALRLLGRGLGQAVKNVAAYIGGFIGSALGPVGAVIGSTVGRAVGWVVNKTASFVKKHWKKLTAAAVGGFIFFGARGALAFTSFSLLAGIVAPILAPMVAAVLIGLAVLIALIMLIINSGAYLVPPAPESSLVSGSTVIESPYISITKVANPVGPFDNTDLNGPLQITYTVTVGAKKGALTNLRFENDCEVIKEGAAPPCSAPVPAEVLDEEQIPTTISGTNPFSFSYTVEYGTGFEDSLILDTFTVTADAPEQINAKAAAVASIVIGTPPTQCYVFKGFSATHQANLVGAAAQLSQNYPGLMAKVCSRGPVNVIYDVNTNPGGWGYFDGTNIRLNGKGPSLTSVTEALYILSHESGHKLIAIQSALFRAYVNYPGIEKPLCSYGNTTAYTEAFSEAIALYVTRDQSGQWRSHCSGTFQTKYPRNWQFVNDILIR